MARPTGSEAPSSLKSICSGPLTVHGRLTTWLADRLTGWPDWLTCNFFLMNRLSVNVPHFLLKTNVILLGSREMIRRGRCHWMSCSLSEVTKALHGACMCVYLDQGPVSHYTVIRPSVHTHILIMQLYAYHTLQHATKVWACFTLEHAPVLTTGLTLMSVSLISSCIIVKKTLTFWEINPCRSWRI